MLKSGSGRYLSPLHNQSILEVPDGSSSTPNILCHIIASKADTVEILNLTRAFVA